MRFATLLILSTLLVALRADEADILTQLPDCDPFHYNAYSGYLTINDDKALHYVFLQSQSDPINDPLLLWFNGGPGCSSMMALLQEHGPWVIDDNEDFIHENPYPWNLRTNIVYIEHPAGVGYSFARNKDTVSYDDMTQSEDLYLALLSFYRKFPLFTNHDLYVTGESYAGIYVPYLAWQIDQHNAAAVTDPLEMHINLRGIVVGNGVTDFTQDMEPSFADTYWQLGIITKELRDKMVDNDCFRSFRNVIPPVTTLVCDEAWIEFELSTGHLNDYDLYRHTTDNALSLTEAERMETVEVDGETVTYKKGVTVDEYTRRIRVSPVDGRAKPVLGAFLTNYMNREDVKEALHIMDGTGPWTQCWNGIDYQELAEGSIWIYPLLKGKYRIMKYSGDTDGVVPTLGTRRWITNLDWPILEKWRPWYTNGQVSGYVTKYNGLDFVTVHGVGHMCPQWKREEVTSMMMAWIHGEDF